MGGGAGVSIHGKFRVATETSVLYKVFGLFYLCLDLPSKLIYCTVNVFSYGQLSSDHSFVSAYP